MKSNLIEMNVMHVLPSGGVDFDCRILEGRCALDGVPVMQLDGFFWILLNGDSRLEEGGCLSCPSSSTVVATSIAANAFTNVIDDALLLFSTATVTAAVLLLGLVLFSNI